jgi:hypothetical protein
MFGFLTKKWLPHNPFDSTEKTFEAKYLKNQSIYNDVRKQFIEHDDDDYDAISGLVNMNNIRNKSDNVARAIANSTTKLHDLCRSGSTSVLRHLSGIFEMALNVMGPGHEDRSYFAYVITKLYRPSM